MVICIVILWLVVHETFREMKKHLNFDEDIN